VPQIEKHFAVLEGVRLHYVASGPEGGAPVLLLHGFPEFWYGWRYQIPALADAGYRVIAPDQRGYNLSDRPRGWHHYDMDLLAGDMLQLMDHLGYDKVHLVGHDWGAQVAWWLAIFHPERFHDLSILNVPHPYVMSRNLRRNPRQLLKSWYIFFFQIPRLPEFLLGLRDNAGLANLLRRSGKPDTFTDEDMSHYHEAWRQPGALSGMLNWYRAIMRRATQPMPRGKITLTTLILWGEQDMALSVEMAEQSAALCADVRLTRFPNATHWVASDAAGEVNAELLAFFARQ
jgi:pimeloyl-ACP methyl ester carboxylesterase